jgi:hypothetical protein
MTLGYVTQSVSYDQLASCSEIDTYEDSALFSSDIAVLYGSGELRSSTRTDCAESPGTVHLQNDRDGGATDARVPIYPMLSTTSGFQNHSYQPSSCAMGQILNAFQCRRVIFWFPIAPDAELLKAVLQEGSAGCPEHVNGHATCCLPENTEACYLQCPRGSCSEHADPGFLATKSSHDHDQCPAPPDGTLNPSTWSLCAETTDISHPPFKCDYPTCKRYFKSQRNLDRHRKNHIGERLHVCWVPGCQRSFSRRDKLKAHYNTRDTWRTQSLCGHSGQDRPSL